MMDYLGRSRRRADCRYCLIHPVSSAKCMNSNHFMTLSERLMTAGLSFCQGFDILIR